MAQVTKKKWRSGPRKVRKVAWGYTLQVDGKQVKKFDSAWTQEDAQNALAATILEVDVPKPSQRPSLSFGQAVDRYLAAKAKKRSIEDDRQHLTRLRTVFGADTPLSEITAARISEYKLTRLRDQVQRDGEKRAISPATLNRELAALRHLVRLAVEEWEVLERAPRVRLEKEPEGRIRWLELDEERRLLEACRVKKRLEQSPHLPSIVTIALETGMRYGEIMGLTWERVDLTRGVFRLELTKSGRRREVPIHQAVYNLVAELSEPRSGRLWPDRSIRRAFNNAVEEAKPEDFTFHDMRHHFASWFVMRGGSLQTLREILGHRDIKTLRYAHLAPGHLRTEIEKTAAPSPKAAEFSPSSAHDGRIEPASAVSPRKAGVAQRQSN